MGVLQSNLKFSFFPTNANFNPCNMIDNDFNPKYENERSELQIKIIAPKGDISKASYTHLKYIHQKLFKAIYDNNLAKVRKYLNLKINLNVFDQYRTSPLHVACRFASSLIIYELVQKNADPQFSDDSGWTPLHVAAYFHRAYICVLLLENGSDKSQVNRNYQTAWDVAGKDEFINEVFKNHSNGNFKSQDLTIYDSLEKIKTKDDEYIKMLHTDFNPELESLNLLTLFPHLQFSQNDLSDSTSSFQVQKEEFKPKLVLGQSYKEILHKFMKSIKNKKSKQMRLIPELYKFSISKISKIPKISKISPFSKGSKKTNQNQ